MGCKYIVNVFSKNIYIYIVDVWAWEKWFYETNIVTLTNCENDGKKFVPLILLFTGLIIGIKILANEQNTLGEEGELAMLD